MRKEDVDGACTCPIRVSGFRAYGRMGEMTEATREKVVAFYPKSYMSLDFKVKRCIPEGRLCFWYYRATTGK